MPGPQRLCDELATGSRLELDTLVISLKISVKDEHAHTLPVPYVYGSEGGAEVARPHRDAVKFSLRISSVQVPIAVLSM